MIHCTVRSKFTRVQYSVLAHSIKCHCSTWSGSFKTLCIGGNFICLFYIICNVWGGCVHVSVVPVEARRERRICWGWS